MPAKNAKHSPAYEAFLASLTMNLDKWRDGIGHDLDALENVTDSERDELLALLEERLSSNPDWREVESIAAIGTPAAMAILRRAAPHVDRKTRLSIEENLADLDQPADVESAIVDALRNSSLSEGLSRAIDMAEEHPTPLVREALLDMALNGEDDTTRVNCAAMALYLGGKADEPFDWNHRPFFLRFGEEDRGLRSEAYKELCERLGVEPKGI